MVCTPSRLKAFCSGFAYRAFVQVSGGVRSVWGRGFYGLGRVVWSCAYTSNSRVTSLQKSVSPKLQTGVLAIEAATVTNIVRRAPC